MLILMNLYRKNINLYRKILRYLYDLVLKVLNRISFILSKCIEILRLIYVSVKFNNKIEQISFTFS